MLGGALRELKIKIIAPLTSELRAQPQRAIAMAWLLQRL